MMILVLNFPFHKYICITTHVLICKLYYYAGTVRPTDQKANATER